MRKGVQKSVWPLSAVFDQGLRYTKQDCRALHTINFLKKDIDMANKSIKCFSLHYLSLGKHKLKTQNIVRYHFTLTRMANSND